MAAEVCLLSFWRWTTPVYRQLLRDDGGRVVAGDDRAALQVFSAARTSGGSASGSLAAPEEWNQSQTIATLTILPSSISRRILPRSSAVSVSARRCNSTPALQSTILAPPFLVSISAR